MIYLAITLIALTVTVTGALIWQMVRASRASDDRLVLTDKVSELLILQAASKVALADKEKALNLVIVERDRLEFAVDTVEDQRDQLLKESLKQATPGTIAISLRDALKRLRPVQKLPETKSLPDMSGSPDNNGS